MKKKAITRQVRQKAVQHAIRKSLTRMSLVHVAHGCILNPRLLTELPPHLREQVEEMIFAIRDDKK